MEIYEVVIGCSSILYRNEETAIKDFISFTSGSATIEEVREALDNTGMYTYNLNCYILWRSTED